VFSVYVYLSQNLEWLDLFPLVGKKMKIRKEKSATHMAFLVIIF